MSVPPLYTYYAPKRAEVELALDYSRNFATAKPDILPMEKEHILGLCNLLERTMHAVIECEAKRIHTPAPPASAGEAVAWTAVDADGNVSPLGWFPMTQHAAAGKLFALREGWRYAFAYREGTHPTPAPPASGGVVSEGMVEAALQEFQEAAEGPDGQAVLWQNCPRFAQLRAMRAALTAALAAQGDAGSRK